MADMLAMVVNRTQDDCSYAMPLPDLNLSQNYSVRVAIGLACEVRMNRLPRRPLSIFG